MAEFYKVPVLQVRDPRAVSDPSEVHALKKFFDSLPPPDSDPTPGNALRASEATSPDIRKQSRKKFFGLGKSKPSNSNLEPEPYLHSANKPNPPLVPAGTVQRSLGG